MHLLKEELRASYVLYLFAFIINFYFIDNASIISCSFVFEWITFLNDILKPPLHI
jgi:hypothetical protein